MTVSNTDTPIGKACNFSSQITKIFLPQSSNYRVGIIGFSVPLSSIPIMTTYSLNYYISIGYGIEGLGDFFISTRYVPYISRSNIGTDTSIHEVSQLLQMLNEAMINNMIDIDVHWQSLHGGAHLPDYYGVHQWVSTPTWVYDNASGKFSLEAPELYYGSSLTGIHYYLYINSDLGNALTGMDVYRQMSVTNREYKILFVNYNNFNTYSKTINGTSYNIIKNIQQSESIQCLNQFTSINFSTNLPIQCSYSDSGSGNAQLSSYYVTDMSMSNLNTKLTYAADISFRFNDVLHNNELGLIEFYVTYTDIFGTSKPLILNIGDSALLRIMFLKEKTNML